MSKKKHKNKIKINQPNDNALKKSETQEKNDSLFEEQKHQSDVKNLEKEIHKLFEREGIGFCSVRYLDTIKHSSTDDEDYKEKLRIRLRQGGVKEYKIS